MMTVLKSSLYTSQHYYSLHHYWYRLNHEMFGRSVHVLASAHADMMQYNVRWRQRSEAVR
jgi:hypothetical protein